MIQNIGFDLQIRLMERYGDLRMAAHSYNVFYPVVADGRNTCLRYHSKVECIRQ